MKRILTTLIILTLTPALFAQTPPERKTGITFLVAQQSSEIALRRSVTPDWTVLGSFGYAEDLFGGAVIIPPAGSGDIDVKTWSAGLGLRRNFRSAELRPFAEITANYRQTDVPGCEAITFPTATVGGGVEYFIASRVSIEGSAGLLYGSTSQHCAPDGFPAFDFEVDGFSTMRTALSITFYF